MALTSLTNLQPTHVHSIGISTFDGSVSVGGTLTYEDVTNVDAIGIITARSGIKVLAGGINAVGVITATSFSGAFDASNLTGTVADARISSLTASKLTGALPAIDGSNLTGISAGTSLSGSTNNTVCTVTGANAIQGEANLTFNGNTLNISGSSDDGRVSIVGHEGYDARLSLIADQGDDHIDQWNIRSKASNNTLTIDQFGGGTFNTRLTIASDANNGDVTVNTGDLIIGTAGKGVDFPNSSLFESSVNMHLDIASGNNDFYIRSGGTTFAAFKGQSKDLQLTTGNLVIANGSKGIDFSADGSGTLKSLPNSFNAELLHDYENGTFTPTIQYDTGTNRYSGSNVSSAVGEYIRIGDLVNFGMKITLTGNRNYSENIHLYIGGLPYNGMHSSEQSSMMTGWGGWACPTNDSNSSYKVHYCYHSYTTVNLRFSQSSGTGGISGFYVWGFYRTAP